MRHRTAWLLAAFAAFVALPSLLWIVPTSASLVLQSQLPRPPENPYFITSFRGGRANCGAQQSAVWVYVPDGFTSAGGAEYHCDPTVASLTRWSGGEGAWDDRGYLIGFWPVDIPIDKPMSLVFEIDPARTPADFSGRYYVPNRGWQALETVFAVAEGRVYITIPGFLSPSEYPGYEDRFLVALFSKDAVPVQSTPKPTPTPLLQVSVTPTQMLTAPESTTVAPSRTPVPTASPMRTQEGSHGSPTVGPTPSLTSSTDDFTTPPVLVGEGDRDVSSDEPRIHFIWGLGGAACLGGSIILLIVLVIYHKARGRL